MKKESGVLMAIFFALFFVSFVWAMPEITFQQTDGKFQPQETILGKIEGTSSVLIRESLKIYEERRELSLEKDILKYNGTYYFYIIPTKEGNFTVKVANLLYKEGGVDKSISLEKNISVLKSLDDENKSSVLTIKPGFVQGTKLEFYLTNAGENNLDVEYEKNKINLSVGETKKISLNGSKITSEFSFIDFKSYKIFSLPVWYTGKINNLSDNSTNGSQSGIINLAVEPSELKIKLLKDEKKIVNITLTNLEENTIENISIKINGTLTSFADDNFEEIFSMNGKEQKVFEIEIKNNKEGYFLEEIFIQIKDGSPGESLANFSVPIEIYIFSDNSTLSNFNVSVNDTGGKTCLEHEGKVCAPNENCEGDLIYAQGYCCLGECKPIGSDEKEFSWQNFFVGLGLVIIVAFILFLIYKKFKGVKSEKVEDKFKRVDENYRDKMMGKRL